MSKARPRRTSPHATSGETELDSGYSLSHSPMHVHLEDMDNGPLDTKTDRDSNYDMKDKDKGKGLEGDRNNVALLIFLYVLQGIPLGLAGSIPYLLQSRDVNYKDQAIFSFVYWPFSVKLLWAPIVDAAYVTWFGRRKSWLVPMQYLLGIFMVFLSSHVHDLLGDTEGGVSKGPVNVITLTATFFFLNFLAATQDIAVDGWAITMLARRNVGWASTCNTIGQTCGYFLGYVVFLALESPAFCNSHLRSVPQPEGMVTLSSFLYFWGIVFLITTTLVMILKTEKPESHDLDPEHGIVETYQQLWKVVKLPSVLALSAILLTIKIGFAAADAVTGLKLIEEGVPRDTLALLGIPMIPIQIILPLVITKYTTSDKPLSVALKAMPFRLLMGLEFALIVWWAPSTRTGEAGEYPMYFYFVVFCSYAVHQVFLYCMFVSIMAFHARVSDPVIGGTYMTLLNTVTNLGGNWPNTVALWLVDSLTWKSCQGADQACGTKSQDEMCTKAGGTCVTDIDGYYIESLAFCIVGFIWLRLLTRKVKDIQALPASAWACH